MAVAPQDPAHPETDYEIGTMNVDEHRATYAWFTSFTKWGSLVIGAFTFMLVLWTSTGAGWIGSIAAFVVVMVLGVLLLRSKPETDGH